MLSKNKYKLVYRTHKDSITQDFYVPAFSECIELNRAAGYFSLQSLILSIEGVIRLVRKNGHINLICSPDLSQSDAELIDACISLGEEHVTRSLKESIIGTTLSDEEAAKLDVVCNMLSEGLLKIKIAYQPLGIFHEKFGIFVDENNDKVYFNGSLNETRKAFTQNHESIRVSCSWKSDEYNSLIENEHQYFNSLWNNNEESVIVMDFPEAVKNDLFNIYRRSATLEEAIDKYINKISSTEGKKNLYSYQKEAIEQFCANGYQHFYEMATGTGKTFTAVKTIERLQHEQEAKKFIVICVPQIDLQVQWENTLKEEGYEQVFLFGGSGSSFERTLSEAQIAYFSEDDDVICVAIYDTFFGRMHKKLANIDSLFVIVDEAHNLTGSNLAALIDLNPRYKLGLSATIQRFSEEESAAIVKFFTPDSTFYYGIEDAIENNFLSKYEYHPILVNLTESENDSFIKMSRRIAQELNKEHRDLELINTLRRERCKYLKQATLKVPKLKELLQNNYNFRNSVVYCGAGKDDDGEKIIDSVSKVLYQEGLIVSQFTSNTLDRKKVLQEFEQGYFDALVAIKCFDEGVDVPKLDKIYIMASDSALRQTVQRRGRVLRKCKETGKKIAHIYDMVVLPAIEAGTYGADGILKIELSRALEYNRLALNKNENEIIINNIASKYHIDINEIISDETESD